jgi:hypothetical protein
MATRTTIIESNRQVAYNSSLTSITEENTNSSSKYGNQPNHKWKTYIPDGFQINMGDQINLESAMINSIGGGDEVMEFIGKTGLKSDGEDLSDRSTDITLGYYINNRYQFNFNLPKSTCELDYNVQSASYGGPTFKNQYNPSPVNNFTVFERNYPYQALEGFSTDVTVTPRVYTPIDPTLKPSYMKPSRNLYNPSDARLYIGKRDFLGPYFFGDTENTQPIQNSWAYLNTTTRLTVPLGFSTPSSVAETLTSQLHERQGNASDWDEFEVEAKEFRIDASSGKITGTVLPAITDATYITIPSSTGRLFYSRINGKWSSAFEGEKDSGGTAVPIGTNYQEKQGNAEFYKYIMTSRPEYYKAVTNSLSVLQTKPAWINSDLSDNKNENYYLLTGRENSDFGGLPNYEVTFDGVTRAVGACHNRPVLLDILPHRLGPMRYWDGKSAKFETNPQAAILDLNNGNAIATNILFNFESLIFVRNYLIESQIIDSSSDTQDFANVNFRKTIVSPFMFGQIDDNRSFPGDDTHVFLPAPGIQVAPVGSQTPNPPNGVGNSSGQSYNTSTIFPYGGPVLGVDKKVMYNPNHKHEHSVYSYLLDPSDFNPENAQKNEIPGMENLYPHNPESLFQTANPTGNLTLLKKLWSQIPKVNGQYIGCIPLYYKDVTTADDSILGENAQSIPFCGFIYKSSTNTDNPLPAPGEYCLFDVSQINTELSIISTTQKIATGLYPQASTSNPENTRPEAYMPFVFAGASDALINFDSGYSKFTLSQFHTAVKTGNGQYQNPTEPPNQNPEQDIMTVNEQEAHMTTVTTAFAPIPYTDQIAISTKQPVISSQSGVAILQLAIPLNTGKPIDQELTATINFYNQSIYNDTLFEKIGFLFEQVIPEYGFSQNQFNRGNYNKYLGTADRISVFQKENNMVRPFTTNAYISSAEMIALAQMSGIQKSGTTTIDIIIPSAKLGGVVRKQATTNAVSDILIAQNLPKKLSYPYLVVYTDIIRNPSYYGGPNGHEKLSAIAYITRNYAAGDFFYSFTTNWNYTADMDYVITDILTDIRLPDGRAAPIDQNSSVIYKIQKPQVMPIPPSPEVIKELEKENDKDDDKKKVETEPIEEFEEESFGQSFERPQNFGTVQTATIPKSVQKIIPSATSIQPPPLILTDINSDTEKTLNYAPIPLEIGKPGQTFYRVERGQRHDPTATGFRGQLDPSETQRNRIFANKTVWMAETPQGAKTFAYENLFGPRGLQKPRYKDLGYTIYKVDADGLQYARLHDLHAKGRQDIIASSLRTAIPEDSRIKEGYEQSLRRHQKYHEHVAPHNKELAIKGDVDASRITVYKPFTSLPQSEATEEFGKKVGARMKKAFIEAQ